MPGKTHKKYYQLVTEFDVYQHELINISFITPFFLETLQNNCIHVILSTLDMPGNTY